MCDILSFSYKSCLQSAEVGKYKLGSIFASHVAHLSYPTVVFNDKAGGLTNTLSLYRTKKIQKWLNYYSAVYSKRRSKYMLYKVKQMYNM